MNLIFLATNSVNKYLGNKSILINILKITMSYKQSRNQQKKHCNALRMLNLYKDNQLTLYKKKNEKKPNDPPHQCEFNKIPWVKEADVFKLFSWPPHHSWLDHITQYVSLPLRILLTSFCVFLNLVCLTTAEKAISEADLVEVCQELDDMLLISSHDSCCVSSQNSASSRAARAPVAPPADLYQAELFYSTFIEMIKAFILHSCLV